MQVPVSSLAPLFCFFSCLAADYYLRPFFRIHSQNFQCPEQQSYHAEAGYEPETNCFVFVVHLFLIHQS